MNIIILLLSVITVISIVSSLFLYNYYKRIEVYRDEVDNSNIMYYRQWRDKLEKQIITQEQFDLELLLIEEKARVAFEIPHLIESTISVKE